MEWLVSNYRATFLSVPTGRRSKDSISCPSIQTVMIVPRCQYLLTPWCRVLLEKLTGLQLVKKFPAFHGTRRLITALTSFCHLSLSWASPIQSIYTHTTSWKSILILSTHLRLGLPSGLFPSGFPTKIHPNMIHPSTPRSPQWSPSLWFPHQDPIHPPILTHKCHMPNPSHSSRFYHPHNIRLAVQII